MTASRDDTPVELEVLDTALSVFQRYGERAVAITHLALRSAGELTDLVAEMHHGISRFPLPFSRLRPNAQRAPLPYRMVRGTLNVTAESVAALPATRTLREDDETDQWRLFRSITNGVLGDKLHRWNNALSYPMAFHDLDGRPLDLNAIETSKGHRLVLFAHGLCLSEREWRNDEHLRFVDELHANGHTVAYLRYNSGRAIHENGDALAALLHRHHDRIQQLTLIGHSMGGLLFRSAFEVARESAQPWLTKVRHTVFLGTPHHGSPLEKVGNLANALLGFSPYTMPLMRLGNIRSRGIKDLRYGCITADASAITDDRRHRDPRAALPALPDHVHALLVSAALQDPHGKRLLGDGLVPIESARGEHADPALHLQGGCIEKMHIEPLPHMQLIRDARVYRVMREWLHPRR